MSGQPEGYDLETCAWCVGDGRERGGGRCTVCRGTGSVMVGQPSRRCPTCLCAGKDEGGGRCRDCGGAGWLGAQGPPDRKPGASHATDGRYEAFLDFMRRHK